MSSKRFGGRGKRAQISSGELLLGYFIFFLAFTIAIALWSTTTEKITSAERFGNLEDNTVDIAEKLVRTKGVPSGWARENVTVIGLADEPRVLNPLKVLEFVDMMNDSVFNNPPCNDTTISDYECNKRILGGGEFEFYFTLTNINGTVMEIENISCVAGREIENETEKLTATRTAILKDEIVQVVLTLWHDM